MVAVAEGKTDFQRVVERLAGYGFTLRNYAGERDGVYYWDFRHGGKIIKMNYTAMVEAVASRDGKRGAGKKPVVEKKAT